MITSVREQNAEGTRNTQCTRTERQIRVERRRNARFGKFFEALNFQNRAGCVSPISGKVEFDGVEACCPMIARHVEKMKQDDAARDKVLEE